MVCCGVLQRVLQYVAMCCSTHIYQNKADAHINVGMVSVAARVAARVAACCSVLHCVAASAWSVGDIGLFCVISLLSDLGPFWVIWVFFG